MLGCWSSSSDKATICSNCGMKIFVSGQVPLYVRIRQVVIYPARYISSREAAQKRLLVLSGLSESSRRSEMADLHASSSEMCMRCLSTYSSGIHIMKSSLRNPAKLKVSGNIADVKCMTFCMVAMRESRASLSDANTWGISEIS